MAKAILKTDGFNLGAWQDKQRQICDDPERRKMLESIPGWSWNLRDEKWDRGFELTKKYGVVSQEFVTPDGYNLGLWQNSHRFRCNDPERRKMLESIPGWSWNLRDAKWNRGYDYTKKHGVVVRNFKTPDGFDLGRWQTNQRTRRSTLSVERQKKLEKIDGWYW